jgi:uncharacterized protein (TIGR02300 family)
MVTCGALRGRSRPQIKVSTLAASGTAAEGTLANSKKQRGKKSPAGDRELQARRPTSLGGDSVAQAQSKQGCIMTTASPTEISKATRGTKRVCQSCEVRFYDLSRDPIVCPACGAKYALAAMPAAESGTRKAPYVAKKGWGDRAEAKRPVAVPAEAEAKDVVHPAASVSEDLEEEGDAVPEVEAAEEDDTVLEPEVDEPDVTGLVDHIDEPKER